MIIAEPGSIIKKTWRIKNLGVRQWPKDVRIVSVTDFLHFEAPKITKCLKPGEMMDLSVIIYIPDDPLRPVVQDGNTIKEYILRLFCDEYKCFGEPFIATCFIDSLLYSEQLNGDLSEDDIEFPRVSVDRELLKPYELAYKEMHREKIPYGVALKMAKQGDGKK